MIAKLHAAVRAAQRQLTSLVNRAVVHLVNDQGKTQLLQVEAHVDEVRDEVEHFQPAGFVSVPLPGCEAVVVAVEGNGDHRIAVVVHDKRSRPTGWLPGETGIYNLKTGDLIRFRADGSIELTATSDVKIKAPVVRIEGRFEVTGDIADAQGSMGEMRAIFNAHGHTPTSSTPPSTPMV